MPGQVGLRRDRTDPAGRDGDLNTARVTTDRGQEERHIDLKDREIGHQRPQCADYPLLEGFPVRRQLPSGRVSLPHAAVTELGNPHPHLADGIITITPFTGVILRGLGCILGQQRHPNAPTAILELQQRIRHTPAIPRTGTSEQMLDPQHIPCDSLRGPEQLDLLATVQPVAQVDRATRHFRPGPTRQFTEFHYKTSDFVNTETHDHTLSTWTRHLTDTTYTGSNSGRPHHPPHDEPAQRATPSANPPEPHPTILSGGPTSRAPRKRTRLRLAVRRGVLITSKQRDDGRSLTRTAVLRAPQPAARSAKDRC
ncbi:hypothetical protein NONO_c37600 [Nocardia nova SH22a]|uniref:Uncharacterized protein n=1 Tax=Nocardia nova SH22a TaxID=1415166 RepID=W5THA8_9NOCA|nr:hypothetical protein NONO_c37600 [Nocardia nova SH22a]